MISKSIQTITLASFVAVSIIAASSVFVMAESGDILSEKKNNTPKYSETCAHGHNGFGCNTPSYRVDIADLQQRVSVLEERASRP